MSALVCGLKVVAEIFKALVLARHVQGRIAPAQEPASETEWEDRIRASAGIGYHPVGTCRMGGDPACAVDPHFKVRGVSGLRVADASILPIMPAANTNAAAIMIGEKAADLILRDV